MNAFSALAAAGLMAFAPLAWSGEAVVSPFAGLVVKAATGKAKACAKSPPPFTGEMSFDSKYAGSGRSRDSLNPLSMLSYKRATADIEAFEKGLAALGDRHVRGQAGAAACALDWMHAWAAADALAGAANGQGKAVRKWALSAVAFNFLKIRDAAGLDAARRQVVRDWISRRADQVVADHADIDPARMNNHHYWAAAAVAASAVATGRTDLLDWSVGLYERAAAAIDADGVLATEMARGTRALEYHNFALAPLVMVAAIGQANGRDLLGMNDCALCRLVSRVEAGLRDPEWFAARAGKRQELEDLSGRIVPWAAPLAALCPGDARLADLARRIAPASARRLGGNLTELYSRLGNPPAASAAACDRLWR